MFPHRRGAFVLNRKLRAPFLLDRTCRRCMFRNSNSGGSRVGFESPPYSLSWRQLVKLRARRSPPL
eukprot:11194495-Lingulodinium_polyedra.AAC.1